jgi:hypothetical protein
LFSTFNFFLLGKIFTGRKNKTIIYAIMNEKGKEKNSKQIIDQEYYKQNREQKILAAKKRYRKIKRQQEKELKKRVSKYSQVENYKVLMSFKDYSVLTAEKHRK